MVQIRPKKNQIRRIVHGHAVHLPDDLLARLRIGHELLLREELVQLWQGMPLVPATAVGDEQLTEAVNGVVEIDGGTRRREQIVAGHLVAAHLRYEHRIELDVDVDLLEELLHNLRVLARQLDIGGTLELDLAPVEFIPIKSSVTKGSDAPGNCAGRNRAPSPDRGPLAVVL